MTMKEISRKYEATLNELRKAKADEIRQYLKDNNLNYDVKRLSDGVCGRLSVEIPRLIEFGLVEVRFYPYKKNGGLSERASGMIFTSDELSETFVGLNR